MMTDYKLVALTNAAPGREAELNQWYEEQHLIDVLATPGFVGAERGTIADGVKAPFHFLTIYDIITDDIHGVMADLHSRKNTERMPMTDAIEPPTATYLFKVAGPRRKS